MKDNYKYLSPWYLFTPLILIVFLLIGWIFFQRISIFPIDSDEYHAQIRETAEQALKEHKPELCLNLLQRVQYTYFSGAEYITDVGNQRENCFKQISEQTLQPEMCEFIKNQKLLEYSNECFERLADLTANPSYCDGLDFVDIKYYGVPSINKNNARLQCKANVSKDPKWCHAMEPDSNEEKYEGAAYCIIEIVSRTGDTIPCLEIDSLDYGVDWQASRNECVAKGFTGPEGSIPTELCQKMVEDHPYASQPYREWCLAGQLPPNDFSP